MIKINKLKVISDNIRENIILRRFLLIISDYLFISFAIFIDIFNHKKDLFFNVSSSLFELSCWRRAQTLRQLRFDCNHA